MAALKRISGIILCLLAILLMSHNTYAVSYGASGVYGWSATNSIFYEVGNYPLSNLSSNSLYSYVGASTRLNGMSLRANSTIPASSLISFTITFCGSVYKGWSGSANQPVVENALATRVWGQAYCYIETVYIYNRYSTNTVATVYPYFMGDNSSSTPSEITVSPMTYVVLTSETSDAALGNIAGILSDMRTQNNDIWNKLNQINNSIQSLDIPSADDIGQAVNDAVEQSAQDAADAAQDAADDSSSDASTATSSLISVIGGFVNVLTSAQPTNCKINANLNHIDMGQLDLCANPVPTYIQIIGSIILICAAIPLAIVLFNRFIGLFRSFQG